jgi:YfiH family protein
LPFDTIAGLKRYTFPLLDEQPVVHGIFTRRGGVSPAPFASLNLGGYLGDPRANQIENRRRIFAACDRPVETIYDPWQVHGTHVLCVERPRPLEAEHVKGDVILTDRPEVTLFMRFADCVPVLLYDPARKVVGLVHAGWRGTVERVAAVAVGKMTEVYGSRPQDVLACVGPSICVDHFEVGPEVVAAVQAGFGERSAELLARRNGSVHLDLWAANRLALEECGVEAVQVSGLCTAGSTGDWYSHRAENGQTGRFGALIAIR